RANEKAPSLPVRIELLSGPSSITAAPTTGRPSRVWSRPASELCAWARAGHAHSATARSRFRAVRASLCSLRTRASQQCTEADAHRVELAGYLLGALR